MEKVSTPLGIGLVVLAVGVWFVLEFALRSFLERGVGDALRAAITVTQGPGVHLVGQAALDWSDLFPSPGTDDLDYVSVDWGFRTAGASAGGRGPANHFRQP